jgi:hypothetical protein
VNTREDSAHRELGVLLTRRHVLARASSLGLGALVLAALSSANAGAIGGAATEPALDLDLIDATLQAFADTMLPGRIATRTDLGRSIHAGAIAGVDDRPGAVEADALALYHHREIGFDALAPVFMTELEARSLLHGSPFLELPFAKRVATCIDGLAYANPTRLVWEAAAAVPFTAFCAAALIPNATAAKASGYRVMGLPGAAPAGYHGFSYGRRLSVERTRTGSLP